MGSCLGRKRIVSGIAQRNSKQLKQCTAYVQHSVSQKTSSFSIGIMAVFFNFQSEIAPKLKEISNCGSFLVVPFFLLFAVRKFQISTLSDLSCSRLPKLRTFFPVSPAFRTRKPFGKTPPHPPGRRGSEKTVLTLHCKQKILHSFGSRIRSKSVAYFWLDNTAVFLDFILYIDKYLQRYNNSKMQLNKW